MSNEPAMTCIDAIKHVMDHFGIASRNELAKSLSDDSMTVQPIQITNYLKGTQPSQKVADRFLSVYGVVISNAYNQSDLADAVRRAQED